MINIGSIIEQKMIAAEMSTAKFSKLIGKTRSNAYDIFTRTTIDTELLKKISEVLNYDFFQYYAIEKTDNILEEPRVIYKKPERKAKISIMIEFDPDINILQDKVFSQKLKELMNYVSK